MVLRLVVEQLPELKSPIGELVTSSFLNSTANFNSLGDDHHLFESRGVKLHRRSDPDFLPGDAHEDLLPHLLLSFIGQLVVEVLQ